MGPVSPPGSHSFNTVVLGGVSESLLFFSDRSASPTTHSLTILDQFRQPGSSSAIGCEGGGVRR